MTVQHSDAGVARPLHAMLGAYREAASATAELAAAELRLAVSTLALLLEIGVALGVLVTSAWLLAMLAIGSAAADGVSWPVALAALATLNLLLAALCRVWMRAIAKHLDFPELRALLANPRREPGPPDSGSSAT